MGQGKFTSAPIDESVGLLNAINRDSLNEIRDKYPSYRSILEIGIIAGEKKIDNEELTVRAELCKLALEQAFKQIKQITLPKLRSKHRFLQRIEIVAQIIIMFSSSTILLGLITQGFANVGLLVQTVYVGAILSLISSILTLVVKRNKNVENDFNTLVNSTIDSEEILRDISISIQFINKNVDKIFILIEKCNTETRIMRLLIEKYE